MQAAAATRTQSHAAAHEKMRSCTTRTVPRSGSTTAQPSSFAACCCNHPRTCSEISSYKSNSDLQKNEERKMRNELSYVNITFDKSSYDIVTFCAQATVH